MQNMAEQKKLFVISGSSGVGKGTVIGGFLKRNPEFKLSISYTTREKREGEVEGVNYFYVSKEEFLNSVKNNEFLEWAEFSGNYYGTKREFVQKCLRENINLILEIETQGALQVKDKMSESVLIFIVPPSYQDLEFRLRNRKTESEEAITKRLDFVKFEIQNSERFDYRIVNDKVENTIFELERIIKSEGTY
ncbi:MAG: guanylate kinase [bacterium]